MHDRDDKMELGILVDKSTKRGFSGTVCVQCNLLIIWQQCKGKYAAALLYCMI